MYILFGAWCAKLFGQHPCANQKKVLWQMRNLDAAANAATHETAM